MVACCGSRWAHPRRQAERNAEIVKMVQETGNGSEVARRLGLSKERVRQIWQSYGPSRSLLAARKPSPQREKRIARMEEAARRREARGAAKEQIVGLYRAGFPTKEIASATGVPVSRVRYVLAHLGIRQRVARCSRDERIIEMMSAGVPQVQIAASLGAHPAAIYQAVKRLRNAGRLAA